MSGKDGVLAVGEMGSHWRLLSRDVRWSFFLLKRITLLHTEDMEEEQTRSRRLIGRLLM